MDYEKETRVDGRRRDVRLKGIGKGESGWKEVT